VGVTMVQRVQMGIMGTKTMGVSMGTMGIMQRVTQIIFPYMLALRPSVE